MSDQVGRASREQAVRAVVSLCLRPQTVKRATVVAVVVGTVLTLINQYDVLLMGDLTVKVLGQMFLTYLVPYIVSTHGQVIGSSGRLDEVQQYLRDNRVQ